MPELFSEENEPLPEFFQKLVEKLKLKPDVTLNEFVFLSVVYNILESGFILDSETMTAFHTYDFNINVLKFVSELKLDDVYEKQDGQFICKLRLGEPGREVVYLTGHPSHSKTDDFIVVNIRTSPRNEIASICILTSKYCPTPFFNIQQRAQFSLDIKSSLAWPIKSQWMQRNLSGAFPHVSALPFPAMRKVESYLNGRTFPQLKITRRLVI